MLEAVFLFLGLNVLFLGWCALVAKKSVHILVDKSENEWLIPYVNRALKK